MAIGAPFSEFSNNKRLLWIAQEWVRYADELAEWAMKRLVNRRDVWSQYTLKDGKISVVMLPVAERRKLGTDMVTVTKLHRHFSGKSPAHLIGLHSISDKATCKWFAIDVDLHDPSVPNADEIAQSNFEAAVTWAERLRELGMDALLFDSNGAGGYHVWVFLDKEYKLADVYDFADAMRSDWKELNLPRKPEIFPPKRAVGPDDLPYTLRTPGRHHTRHHYTRVWNFDADAGENEWLEGGDAIEAILAVKPSKLPKKATKRNENLVKAPTPKVKGQPTTRKPRVCVDLDGVLAQYDKWKGVDHIGDPVDGAVEFAKKLAKIAEITIFTSRCAQDVLEGSRITPGQLRIKVVDWLEQHGIPYSDVYIGQGKPRAAAFIDDRAVRCDPQNHADAFQEALASTRTLLKKPHGVPEAVKGTKYTGKYSA